MKINKQYIWLLCISVFVLACSKNDKLEPNSGLSENETKELTIFHINDQHGRLKNFAKIKHIIDKEKEQTNVLFVCAGDVFSGNPVVDNHDEKGYPMIDLMNMVGVDVSVIGNHEYDYGESILNDRIAQSQFIWICANVDMTNSIISQPPAYTTVSIDGLKISFLGLVETFGSDSEIIPSTHPWRVENLNFTNYQEVITNYADLKNTENADLLIALTHLGHSSDGDIANSYPYFDLIIGGHSHSISNRVVNDTPLLRGGSNLDYLGKIKLTIKDKDIESMQYELINLNAYTDSDDDIESIIDAYNISADLDEVIGFSEAFHSIAEVGFFYTDALQTEMNVDLTFQNTGGIRNTLDAGDITKREIYTIDPFNNGSVSYDMTVGNIKTFLRETNQGVYYSGMTIERDGNAIEIRDSQNQLLNDNTTITIGLNDYIPAVYSTYFTQTPTNLPYTTAEAIISFLENSQTPVNYTLYTNFFQYQ